MITHLSRVFLHNTKTVTYLASKEPSLLISRQFSYSLSRRLFYPSNNIGKPIKINNPLSLLQQNQKILEISLRAFASEEQKFQDLVSVKDEGTIVYEGPLKKQIVLVKFFSLSTSVLGLIIQPMMISKALPYGSLMAIAVGSFIGIYAFVTPIILHWIVKRYVISMNFNRETGTFTSTTLSLLFRKQKTVFTADDVHIPDVPGPFTSFVAKGKAFLVAPAFFSDRSVYAHLMGYDKPLNLELKTDKQKTSESEKQ